MRWRDRETGQFVSFTNIRRASKMMDYWDRVRKIQTVHPDWERQDITRAFEYYHELTTAEEKKEWAKYMFSP